MSYNGPTQLEQYANLHSLPNGDTKPLGLIDLSSTGPADECRVQLIIPLASSGVSSTGTIEVYWIETLAAADGYTDGISPTDTTDVESDRKNAPRLAILNANANSQVVNATIDIHRLIGAGWARGSLLIKNKSGATTAGTGADAQYSTATYE